MNTPRPFLIALLALAACGGDDGATVPVAVVPAAPTSVVVTPGNASASVVFVAPTSTGGSVITSYIATCAAGNASFNGTATASPITVSGLTNGTAYTCTVRAVNAVGSSLASSAVAVTPAVPVVPATGLTSTVGCGLTYTGFNSSPKVNANSTFAWSCAGVVRTLAGNGIPEHTVTGGNFATPIGVQTISATFSLNPLNTGMSTALGGPAGTIGYALNSAKFDPGTDGTCASNATSTAQGGGCVAAQGRDPWRLEAIGGAFVFGTDENNAHVQPNGQYHYHGMPTGIITRLNKGQALTLVGWAADGFPVYARYGYTVATSAASPVKVVASSYQKKATPDAGRPSVTVFPMGTFTQDYQYVAGSGDLDDCNGRTGVTPEFPNGIYHYYITETFPFIQRCVKGSAPAGGGPPPAL